MTPRFDGTRRSCQDIERIWANVCVQMCVQKTEVERGCVLECDPSLSSDALLSFFCIGDHYVLPSRYFIGIKALICSQHCMYSLYSGFTAETGQQFRIFSFSITIRHNWQVCSEAQKHLTRLQQAIKTIVGYIIESALQQYSNFCR